MSNGKEKIALPEFSASLARLVEGLTDRIFELGVGSVVVEQSPQAHEGGVPALMGEVRFFRHWMVR